jgi:signal transduction histidine kinase
MPPFWVPIDTYVALAVVLVNFIFATFILIRTPCTIIYLIYFFICIANMVWNFGDFMTVLTGNRVWFYLSLIGSAMLPSLMYHWILTMAIPERKSSFMTFVAYLFSVFLATSSPLALFLPNVKWFVDSELWNILYLALLGPFIFAGITMLFQAIQRTKAQDEKSRLYYILAAVIIGVFTGLSDLVQVLKVPIPPLGHLGCLTVTIVLAIGVFKHRTAYDVLAQMRINLESMAETAAAVAHEIRNPLTSIKGACALLSSELADLNRPRVWEYHTIICEEIDRLDNIVESLQYFTKPIKSEKEVTSINNLIERTVKLLELNPIDLKIRLDLSEHLPMIQADASLLKQVFLNLIKNAAEACGPGGELVVRAESTSPWIRISFSDNGPGIPLDSLQHIFEPFYTTKATGMGVGLAVSQRIIEAHDGRIEARNGAPGGAQFSILLPL